MCSPTITRTHEETKIKSSAREILSSVSSVISINIILVEQVLSTVKKPNQSPWQNAEIYRSYSHCHIQRFLLSLWHLFCWRIAKANWKILKLPWHFIAKALSTWILKADFINDGKRKFFLSFQFWSFLEVADIKIPYIIVKRKLWLIF